MHLSFRIRLFHRKMNLLQLIKNHNLNVLNKLFIHRQNNQIIRILVVVVNTKKQDYLWMQTARQFSWLIAVFLFLNQSFVFSDGLVGNRNSTDSFSVEAKAHTSDCTLSEQNNRNTIPFQLKNTALIERPIFHCRCILPSYHVSRAQSGIYFVLNKIVIPLRV